MASDIGILVREELAMARAEMMEKVQSAGVGAGMLSGSAVTGLFALACLTALLVAALSTVIPLWAALLAATILWGIATAVLALVGKQKVSDALPLVPERTIRAVKEDIEAAKSPR